MRIDTNVSALIGNPLLGRASWKSTTNIKARAISSLIAIVFAVALAAIPASAQVDPGVFSIRQNGVQVGVIFVPQRDPGAVNYVEDWVLFDNYVYPGGDASLVTTISMSAKDQYRDEADFFARVAWGKGYRYVRVDSTDTNQLPGR